VRVPDEVLSSSLVDRLVTRASSDRPAFTYLDYPPGDEVVERTLTWAGLVQRVRSVAQRLRELAVPGSRVAIVAPQDLSYPIAFLSVLYAGLVAVPLFDPVIRAHRARLVAALTDCTPDIWLTSTRTLARVEEFAGKSTFPPAHVVAVEGIEGSGVGPAEIGVDDPAYLQYTSGSTREPAGAVITHRALSASCWQVSQAYTVDDAVTCAGWIPFFHDMGLIQLLCLPVFTGARSVFMAPVEFVRRPERWLRQLSEYPNVFTAAPNFAFDLAAETVPPPLRDGLDLSGVRVALNGSEPVRPETIAAFDAAFGPCGFKPEAHRPSYGLAEATVYVASAGSEGPTITGFDRAALSTGQAVEVSPDSADRQELVSVGRPLGQSVHIVDQHSRQIQPDGTMGEIWVHGPHVAAGYWNRSDDSFDARISGAGVPPEGWLRTGDLGVVHRGRLYVTGRIKDLVIIDGRNHYPEDIEATVARAHPAIRPDRIAAFAIPAAEGEGVVVVAERARDTDGDPEEVARAVRRAVSQEHDVALRAFHLVPVGAVPRTSSGKVSRSAARARYGDGHG
jgi:acyl-CoA synthetase (AMP-forming)/AMP-acid ligase II